MVAGNNEETERNFLGQHVTDNCLETGRLVITLEAVSPVQATMTLCKVQPCLSIRIYTHTEGRALYL